jgi:hypothetical protein
VIKNRSNAFALALLFYAWSGLQPAHAAGDLAVIFQAVILYLGGPAGGFMLAAALIVVAVLCFLHVMDRHSFIQTAMYGALAWGAAFMVRTFYAW